MPDIVELSKRFVVPMPAVRATPATAPRMTMARLPQWIIDNDGAEDSRDDLPPRMTMSRLSPAVRTTIGRQR